MLITFAKTASSATDTGMALIGLSALGCALLIGIRNQRVGKKEKAGSKPAS
jgi:hypothetical protein